MLGRLELEPKLCARMAPRVAQRTTGPALEPLVASSVGSGLSPGRPRLSDHWGFDRGTPVDRVYIERCTPRQPSRRSRQVWSGRLLPPDPCLWRIAGI